MESLRNFGWSLWGAVRAVRVWLLSWFVFTVTALIVVWPAWRALDEELTHHPGASFHLDQALDADVWRTRPELAVPLGGALLLALLFGAFLSGGILATLGRSDRQFRFAQMLGEGGFLFARNVRALGIGLLLALALGFGFARLDAWLVQGVLYDVEPGAIAVRLGLFDLRWIHLLEGLGWLRGFAFLGLLFVGKVAMARLAEGPHRSALLAWGTACWRVLRRPIRAVLIVGLWTAFWLAGSHALGELTVQLLEVRRDLLLGAAAGQAGIVLGQWVLIGLLLGARRFLGATPAQAGSA